MQNFINSYELNFSNKNTNGNQSIIMYDIEEHLRQFRDSKHFNILYNCWMIEKKEYKNRLHAVAMTYQTYSLHDATHSETILRQIAYFLGEDRIRQLSPTDAWLILECAYCHDLGMIVTAEKLYDELAKMEKEDFEKFSREMRESENDDVRSSWRYLEPLFKSGYREKHAGCEGKDKSTEKYRDADNLYDIFELEWYKWPTHFTMAFRILIQEYCRPKHAQMSYDMIRKEADEKSYEGLIPLRFRHLIAEIAAIHMDKRENVIEKLSQKIQGFDGDYAHPQFVAELIRIGDLLDMDNNRFNKYQLAVAGNVSYNSFAHQLKHRALVDFLVTPEIIRVKADCTTEDARKILQSNEFEELLSCSPKYNEKCSKNEEEMNERAASLALKAFKELSGWLQMLHQELDFFCKNWLRIVPENLIGACPYFEKEILLLDNKCIENDLIDLRYHIAAKRAAQIIEGSDLYKDIFVAFVREIIQNSMDAIKRKIYLDLVKNHQDKLKNPLEFYRYIAHEINQITICVECKEKPENDIICFKIKDYGTGITYKRLKEMQHIGDDPDFRIKNQSKMMPAWWKPTGSFGIGMQTIFYFSDIFKLVTRTEEEGLLRKMFFNSIRVGGKIESYVIEDVGKTDFFKFGTEIEVNISTQMIRILQRSGQFGTDLDYFGDTSTLFQNKIEDAVKHVRGSFGIPVNLMLSKSTDNIIDKGIHVNEYLLRCFGVYFINLAGKKSNDDSIVKVLEHDVNFPSDEKYCYSGFSCWSEDNRVLLRYRWKREESKEDSFKIYFNEIRVDDENIEKVLSISFFDVEIYLFDENAENYLKVNRDKFLYEKYRYIVDIVCNTHLNCLCFLMDMQEKSGETAEIEYKRAVWREQEDWNRQGSVKNYLEFLIKKEDMKGWVAGIKWFVQREDLIQQIGGLPDGLFPIKNNDIWLMGVKKGDKYTLEIHLRKHFNIEARYIVEDVFPCCMELAVTELICMQERAGDYIILYKVARRSGKLVSVDEENFRSYIAMRYQEPEQKEQKLGRIILPGIEEYRELCVNKLSGNMGTTFEKKLDSAIILPVTLGELEEVLKEKEEKLAEKLIEDRFLAEDKASYINIVEYIKSSGIVRDLDNEDIKIAYRKLLMDIWRILHKK